MIHLHNHTEYSALDGLSTCAETVERAAHLGMPALAITDHGTCAGHPQFQHECDKAGIKPIFGIETYFVPDRLERPPSGDKEAQKRLRPSKHLILLATSDKGLRDLWALSSEAYRSGHYHKPRVDWELLERYGSELICTSSCLGGLVAEDLLEGRSDAAVKSLTRMKSIFGDRFYLEIQGNYLPQQHSLNKYLAILGDVFDIPLMVASDSHYASPEQAELHKLWIRCQTGSPADDPYWNYVHQQSEDETRAALAYLDPAIVEQAIRSTEKIAEQCNARISGHAEPPIFYGSYEEDSRALLDLCLKNWHKVPKADSRFYQDRMYREWTMVDDKRLAGCYLIVWDVISWARSQGALVGPGRGSAAGSLMSYLISITSMDPIRTGLLFERFLTPGRAALPDFDMDFPTSWRPAIQNYVSRKYGEDRVVRVGTNVRYKAKGILEKLFSVMLPGEEEHNARIASIIDEAESHTAGLGLPWDDLMVETGPQLAPYIERFGKVFEMAAKLQGRIHTYGRHPAGLVISTSTDLATALPMRLPEDSKEAMISQFDYRACEEMGLLKLDFLTLRTLDTIDVALRLVEARTGQRPDPPQWEAEHDDPQVWDEIGTGATTGMFQIETSLGVDICRRMKPRSLQDMAAVVALVRPGPRNSGMTESFLRRRKGTEEATSLHPLLEHDLAASYGLMIYQEDILRACRTLAGYDDLEADGVRKILGKKLIDKIEEAGREFVARAHQYSRIELDDAAFIWENMAEFGRYGFNLAHAYAYGTLSYWTAWLKVHYPVETLTAILSTLKKKDRMPVFATEARRLGIKVLPPDVRISGASFLAEGLSIRYGLSSVKGVGTAAITGITAGQPYSSLDDFVARSRADNGIVYALAKAGALDPLVATRRALVSKLEADRSGQATRCIHKDEAVRDAPNGLPCRFDWAAEPQPEPVIGKSGKPLKVRLLVPPKSCTRACRNYTPPGLSFANVAEYPPGQLWALEEEIYGTWMSPAIFEQLDRIDPGLREMARSVALMLPQVPHGTYTIAAIHGGLRTAYTRSGNIMWWERLVTEVSTLDVAVFSPRRDDEPDVPAMVKYISKGTPVVANIVKDAYRTPAGQWRTSWRLDSLSRL